MAPHDCPKKARLSGSTTSNDAPKSRVRPHQNLSTCVCRMPDRPSELMHLKSADSHTNLPPRSERGRSINCTQEVPPRKEPLMADRNVSFLLSKRALIGSQRQRRP